MQCETKVQTASWRTSNTFSIQGEAKLEQLSRTQNSLEKCTLL